jgi:protoporphyrinogen oxidase/predicted heme/steroid binding protein
MSSQQHYDLIIVGAGLAGLYAAYYAKQHLPQCKILVLETQNQIGGRIKTIHHTTREKKGITFEAGAARIAKTHTHVHQLLKALKLSHRLCKLPSYLDPAHQHINDEISSILKQTHKKRQRFQQMHTFQTASKEHARLKRAIVQSGYNAPLEIQNVENYYNYFTNSIYPNIFYKLRGGLNLICTKLLHTLGKQTVKCNCTVTNFHYLSDYFEVETPTHTYTTSKLILAIPKAALLKLPAVCSIPHLPRKLKAVHENKYIRIFAFYPKNTKTDNKVWFYNLPDRTTSATMARQVIIIDRESGCLEVYCDSQFAARWHNEIINGRLLDTFQKCMKRIFPTIPNIPPPLTLLPYYWKAGSHFWKVGANSHTLYNKILHPQKGLFICGEAYSKSQAWMEGCIRSVNDVFTCMKKEEGALTLSASPHRPPAHHASPPISYTKTKATLSQKHSHRQSYTLEEVSTHSTPKDAWVAYKGDVFNITAWIPKHPGGEIILKGVGKDITALFDSIGHSEYALQQMQHYKIGALI